MSKRRWVAARLFAVLGGAGLAIGVCAPRALAATPPPFSNTNYDNRYICNTTSDGNFFTAVYNVNPNGSGSYTSGTLVTPLNSFGVVPFNPADTPEDNSCSYSLVGPSSSYVVSSNGLTTEVLTWMASAGNDPSCPDSPLGSFVMSSELVLRANVNSAGKVQQLSISSGNLLDQSVLFGVENPGDGYCLK
jgi:hypothetical protein